MNNFNVLIPLPVTIERRNTQSIWNGITGNNMFVLSIEKDMPREPIELKVGISEIQHGLGRINKPDHDECFYYTPAILFGGTINFCDKNTGEVIDSVTRTLFTINAVDGSII